MSDHLEADGSFVNSIVGEGTRFTGELELNGLLRIDGDYSGTIRTTGKVLVGKNGRAECTINAGTVVVGGIIKGNVFAADKVIILSTGMILGNVNTPRLIVEEGVLMHGNCLIKRLSDQAASPAAKSSGFSYERLRADSDGSIDSKRQADSADSHRTASDEIEAASLARKESVSWKR